MDEKMFHKKILDWSHNVFGSNFKEDSVFLDGSFRVKDLTAFSFASSDAIDSRLFILVDESSNLLAGSIVDSFQKSVAVNTDSASVAKVYSALSEKFSEKSDALVRYEKGATAKWWQKEKWATFWLLFPCCVVFTLFMVLLHARDALGDNWPTVITTVSSVFASEYLSKKYGLGYLSDEVKDEIAAREILSKAKCLISNDDV